MIFRTSIACIVLALLVTAGCGSKEKIPPLGQVSGTLTDASGNPIDGVKVMFLPDPEKEVFGRPSSGVTDANGKFILLYNDKADNPGTAIGFNRVILKDLKSIRSSRDENPIPPRFGSKYKLSKSTDLSFDVKEGEQTIDIQLK